MKKVLFLAVAALSFSLTSCDNKAKEATDKKADAMEASTDAKAAGMNAAADSTQKMGEKAADAVKDSASKKM